MSNQPINIYFDYEGYYSKIVNGYEWNPRDAWLYAISFRDASVTEITHSMLIDKICRKVGVDKSTTKLKISYMPVVVSYQRQSYVLDDEDVYTYLTSLDAEQRRSVLHVEVCKDLEIIPVGEQGSRAEKRSSYGVNYSVGSACDGGDARDGFDGHGDARDGGDACVDAGAVTIYAGEKQAEQPQSEQPHDSIGRDYGDGGNEEGNGVSDDDVGEEGMNADTSGIQEYVDLPNTTEESQFREGWDDGMGLVLHQEFESKQTVIDLVDRASQQKCFGVTVVNSDKSRYVVKCEEADEGCEWYLRVAKIKNSSCFSVRVYRSRHTCSRTSSSTGRRRRKGTPRLVASVLNEDYPGELETPTPKAIIGLVQGKLGVEVSYSTALRGKKEAVINVRGSAEDGFKNLYSYLYMLETVNPGTKTSLVLDEENRFKYLFVALGASIEGFQVMRKVIIVDATFLKSEHGGVLIFATAQDGNRHNYPIAFAVVDGEKDASWTWFFNTLKTIIPDSPELVFVSDRNASLIKAIGEVYPSSNHGYCIFHLSQNIRSKVSYVNKDEVAKKFREIAQIYTVAEFQREYGEFRRRYPAVAAYLDESVKEEKWAKCYFPGERYNIYTTNSAESMNGIFVKERKYSLLHLLDAIIGRISKWFNQHRKESIYGSDGHKMVPYVENIVHNRCELAAKLAVIELNAFELEYSVFGRDGKTYVVSLKNKSCCCRCLDIDKFPCVHSIAATIKFLRQENRPTDLRDLYGLCSPYYMVSQWAMAYCRTIYPVPDADKWMIPVSIRDLYAYPPIYIKRKGRRQEKRYPSEGERRRRTRNKTVPGRDLGSWFESEGGREE